MIRRSMFRTSIGALRDSCALGQKRTFSEVSQCPLYPQKRTWIGAAVTSALCQKRTLARLFNHLLGSGKQSRWDRHIHRLGGLTVGLDWDNGIGEARRGFLRTELIEMRVS